MASPTRHESGYDDNDWDVIAAREMFPDEIVTFDRDLSDLLSKETEAHLPAPDTDVPMVSRSLRLPVDLDQRIRQLADARGIGATTLMRQLIEAGVAEMDDNAVVPLADVHQALAALARRHHVA